MSIDDLIITQALILVKCRWTTSNLLGADAIDVHDVLLYTHVYRLPRFTSQVSLDTLECFVG